MDVVRWVRLSAVLVLVVTLYFVAPVSGEITRDTVGRVVLAVAVLAGLAFAMVRQLRWQLDGTTRRVDGLVASIAVVIVVFSYAFYTMAVHHPDQVTGLRTRLDALYFVVTNLTTIGTGDVHATGQAARALVLVQVLFNVVFVATAVSLLSSRVRAAAEARAEQRRHPLDREPPSPG
jgi:voltage-gated potassium channel